MPPSTAALTMGSAASSSSTHGLSLSFPKLIIPRQTLETRRPVLPRFAWRMPGPYRPTREGNPRPAANRSSVGPTGHRRLTRLALATAMLAGVPAVAHLTTAHAVDSPVCRPRTRAPVVGITAATRTQPDPVVHPRLERWSLTSAAMSGATMKVNVLLPNGYAG